MQRRNADKVTNSLPAKGNANQLLSARQRFDAAKRKFNLIATDVAAGAQVQPGIVDSALSELNAAQAGLRALTESHIA